MNESRNTSDPKPSHSYLSCAEVARRIGLSRQRFWQLRRDGVFPEPQHQDVTGRPYYSEDQVAVCMDLRRRNVGLNGKVVLFYSVRPSSSAPKIGKKKLKKNQHGSRHQQIIDSLKLLGLASVNENQVDNATKELFPGGTDGIDEGEIVRQVFLYLERQRKN